MKKFLDYLPSKEEVRQMIQRATLAAILAGTPGCLLDRSGLASIDSGQDAQVVDSGRQDALVDSDVLIADAQVEDGSISDSGSVADSGTHDAGEAMIDSGLPPPAVRCGRGLVPGYPLTLGIPARTAIQAELAVADRMPDPGVVTGIAWGDSPSLEIVAFSAGAPSQALAMHSFSRTGTVTATWFVNETECGMQTFDVIPNICTGNSAGPTSTFRVGDAIPLTLFNSAAAPDDTYTWGHLPADPNTISRTGMNSVTITAEDPPGPAMYLLTGQIRRASGQYFDCPNYTITVIR